MNVQEHMMRTYIKYIQHTLVREDALKNKKIKGSPTDKKGRQIIRPEQMGHDVQTSGVYEYCLGCGRETQAKHNLSAKRIFWRRQYCKPVVRMERYRKRKHDIIVDEWWTCRGCKARGPESNKRDCTQPTEKQDEDTNEDGTDKHDHRNKRRKLHDI
eukprot:16409772-Heterocapsa_arctica.AAC.1